MLQQSILVEFDIVSDAIADVVEEEVINFHNAFVDVGEDVRDSGNFVRSTKDVQRLGEYSWLIENTADYASILARGRRQVGGRWYGSTKWADGIDPMIAKLNNTIERRGNAL